MITANSNICLIGISTPLGTMLAGSVPDGICLLEFADRPALEKEKQDLCRLLDTQLQNGSTPLLEELKIQLDEYFAGTRKNFDIPLVAPGTPFQQKVWKLLREIPYGSTRTYKYQAIKLGNIKSIRAVGKANGDNRISIIIPCHRVIGENGDLIGYGGGKHRKKWLLEHERKYETGLKLFE